MSARITVEADDPAAAQAVTGALGLLAKHRRSSGLPLPSWLVGAVVVASHAPTCQERTPLDSAATEGDGRAVPPLLVSLADAATALGVSRRTVARAVADGSLATVRLGRRRLIRPGALERFADSLPPT